MLSELRSGMAAFWKGSLRWRSLKKLHLTLPHFWPKLAWDEESSNLKPKQAFFSQGGPADSIFYLQRGRAKLTCRFEKR